MKIAVFGMGYVGCVTAAVFCREGHQVVGVDPNRSKLDLLARGRSPIVEPGLEELIAEAHSSGRLTVSGDPAGDLANCPMVFVCVGTPSDGAGRVDTRALVAVSRQIGQAFAQRKDHPIAVLRSTVLPDVLETVVLPNLFGPKGSKGAAFGFVVHPEFLREGSAIEDFDAPPFTLVGTDDLRAVEALERLYAFLPTPVIVTDPRTASAVKYAANAFHALKVAFANEIDTFAQASGVDGAEVMRLLCRDEKLNISSAYLRPGMPFGGSCLPKDVRALARFAQDRELTLPLLCSILESNARRIEASVERILASGGRRVGILGLSFKPGTDDLRESPSVTIVEKLLERGVAVAIYDPRVLPDRLLGANRDYLLMHLPGFADLLCRSLEDLLSRSDVIALTTADAELLECRARMRREQVLVDLTGATDPAIPVARVRPKGERRRAAGISGSARPES